MASPEGGTAGGEQKLPAPYREPTEPLYSRNCSILSDRYAAPLSPARGNYAQTYAQGHRPRTHSTTQGHARQRAGGTTPIHASTPEHLTTLSLCTAVSALSGSPSLFALILVSRPAPWFSCLALSSGWQRKPGCFRHDTAGGLHRLSVSCSENQRTAEGIERSQDRTPEGV